MSQKSVSQKVVGPLPAARAGSWFSRNGWLLAATWLVFLVFPWLTIVGADDLAPGRKLAATLLIVAFAAAYVDGFRREHRGGHERAARSYVDDGRAHFAILVALGAAVFALAGPAALGMMPFVVAFAVFHFGWSIAWAALIAGTTIAVVVPIATDSIDDLWSMSLIVVAVGVAAMLIRGVEASESRQANLRTQLAISGERNRVARDVHDVLGHSLTAITVKSELCERLLDGVETDDRERIDACRAHLAELRAVSRGALAEIRATVGGLRAASLPDEVTVARTVLADAGVELLVTGETADVPEHQQPVLAWVVREAVTNVVRHAGATRCHIELGSQHPSERVVLRISDDGVGLAGRANGNGLRGVRERVEAAGGDLRLRSDDGTTLEVALA